MRMPALIFLGFLPQFFAFYFPVTRVLVSDRVASACLIVSQVVLMAFVWKNLSLPGMPWLMAGLGCNLAVILANGGFMPLPLETLRTMLAPEVLTTLVLGERLGLSSKDILLPEAMIRFPQLADRFATPLLFSHQFAYSAGDVGIALGAFLALARPQRHAPTNILRGKG